MGDLDIMKVFAGARDLCPDIGEAIKLVCAITKSSEEEVVGLLVAAGVLIVPGSGEEREIERFISGNAGTNTVEELIGEVGFRFCISDKEAARLVKKWVGFPWM